jgi:hypothetical protein
MSQQLKLSNFLKRKGDNVTGANKQSKSSSIDNVEIVDASLASKAVKVKLKVAVAAEKNVKRPVCLWNHIGRVMVSMFVSRAVDREFEPQSGQTKAYEIRPQCGILILVARWPPTSKI